MKPTRSPIVGQKLIYPGILNLSRGGATALIDRETRNRRDAITRLTQRFERRRHASAERTNCPRRDNGDASRSWVVRPAFFCPHFLTIFACFIPLALPRDLP
jgi:hypothetical protein